MTPRPPLFSHQQEIVGFLQATPRAFIASDPGTGKTRSVIEFVARRKAAGEPHRTLVFAPKTILVSSWATDLTKYSDLTYHIADADNRRIVTQSQADMVITNHDAVNAIEAMLTAPHDYAILVIDESTAFKNTGAARTKKMMKLASRFPIRICMSGTPNPNGVTDLWSQYYILDEGETLGPSFWKFRNMVCQAVPNGQFTRWEDAPGSAEAVADLVSPITIRHRLEDVVDIPPNYIYPVNFVLEAPIRKLYDDFLRHLRGEMNGKTISALNAGSRLAKLLQIASGAVYAEGNDPTVLSTKRYELIADLVEQREQCVVAFNWQHQRDQILAQLKRRGIRTAVIDGSIKQADREEAVSFFQNGLYQVILANPASASHGLTLTRGTTTIWSSPTFNAEFFSQFNHRVYRAGQTRKTETLLISALGTVDEYVYEKLGGKVDAMTTLLSILQET